MTILILDKIDFLEQEILLETKIFNKDIIVNIQQEIVAINVYAPKNKSPKIQTKTTGLKEIENSKILVEIFISHFK